MEAPPKDGPDANISFGDSLRINERTALWIIIAAALAIRVYLSLTSFCISGDGVAYLAMAREFAAGDWRRGLDSVFSPLYPILIAAAHSLIPDWEVAGNLVSAIMGTAAVATVYLMIREAFADRRIAIGAAALLAIHPELAAYSASVRTEAGYVCLLTAATWLLLKGLRQRSIMISALAGAVGGLAYLYRTEGIGFIMVACAFFPAAALFWKQARIGWAFSAAAVMGIAFLVIASPYMAFLRITSGHWTIGREFTAAMMYGMGDVASNSEHWRNLGFSPTASPFAPIFADPRLFVWKVRGYFIASFYDFTRAQGPILTGFMVIGLWMRGRRIFIVAGEALLATMVVFYFCGFSLSYTGTRFMLHLIPYTFGWVIIGIMATSDGLVKLAANGGWRVPHGAVPMAIAIALLPRTLWPIGYDMRGVRYAGEDIAQRSEGRAAVVARDGRVAYYAGARFIGMPIRPVGDFCTWLEARDAPGYLVIGNRDERVFSISAATPCLEFIKRYPRYGSGYYDLYAIRQAGRGGTLNRAEAR